MGYQAPLGPQGVKLKQRRARRHGSPMAHPEENLHSGGRPEAGVVACLSLHQPGSGWSCSHTAWSGGNSLWPTCETKALPRAGSRGKDRSLRPTADLRSGGSRAGTRKAADSCASGFSGWKTVVCRPRAPAAGVPLGPVDGRFHRLKHTQVCLPLQQLRGLLHRKPPAALSSGRSFFPSGSIAPDVSGSSAQPLRPGANEL